MNPNKYLQYHHRAVEMAEDLLEHKLSVQEVAKKHFYTACTVRRYFDLYLQKYSPELYEQVVAWIEENKKFTGVPKEIRLKFTYEQYVDHMQVETCRWAEEMMQHKTPMYVYSKKIGIPNPTMRRHMVKFLSGDLREKFFAFMESNLGNRHASMA